LNRDRESMPCISNVSTASGLRVSEADLEMSCYGNFIAFVKELDITIYQIHMFKVSSSSVTRFGFTCLFRLYPTFHWPVFLCLPVVPLRMGPYGQAYAYLTILSHLL
jgi:hypothetical protein